MNARIPKFTLPLLVLASFASTGCGPTLVWLPDSSGIIYTTTNWPGTRDLDMPTELQGRLLHYDLKAKSTRIIAKAETNTIQPALSPDGKQIAVARLKLEKDEQPTLQVVVYDLEGKETHRSKLFEWGGVPKYDTEVGIQKYSQLFWASHENKVLVYANNLSGIYDLGKDQVVMLGHGGHARPSIFGTTPVRPDGKGFLLVKGDPGFLEPGVRSEALAFVDREGNESAIAMPDERLDVRVHDILYTPAASSWSRWDGEVAIATWNSQEWRIDTARKTAVLQNVNEAVWALDGKEIQQLYTFPGGKTKLAVLYLTSRRDSHNAGWPAVGVDLIGPEPDRRRTLIEGTPCCGVFPSPNNELVALRYMAEGKNKEDRPRDMVLVVNEKGDAVADFDAGN